MNGPTARSDAWQALRKYTPARVALGRAGGSVPTAELLDFAVAHAAARDAVYAPFEAEAVRSQLQRLGLETILLNTQAVDRAVYLRRPNLGRRLEAESRDRLAAAVRGDCDVALVVGDGLSAPAAGRNAATVLEHLLPRLRRESLSVGPACVVRGARVAVQDEIGEVLRARVSVILLGERPGLLAADSLGAYLMFAPRPGRTDAERNCVSNIRPGGLSPESAAETIAYLIVQSLRRGISGVALKDDRAPTLPG